MPDDIEDKITLPGDDAAAQVEVAEESIIESEDDGGDGEGLDYSEEELAALSDAERAALLGDDADEGDGATDGDEQQSAPEAVAQAAANPAPDAHAQAEPQPVDGDLLQAELDRIADAAAEQRQKALQDYDDGEISPEDYRAKLAEIDSAMKQSYATARETVQFEQVRVAFTKAAVQYLDEIPGLKDPAHIEAYDRHVRFVTGNPAMAHLTPRQMLETAHRLYAEEASILGREAPKPPGAKAKEPAPAQAKEAKPKLAPKPEPVPTLARIPAAAQTEVAGGRWSALQARFDAAGPAERERIMASLSDAEREEFASYDA